jgi:hypothetical protein
MGKGEETGKNRKLGDGQKGGERGYGEERMIWRGDHCFKTLSCFSFLLKNYCTLPKMVKPTVNTGNFVLPSRELCLLHNPPYKKSLPVPGLGCPLKLVSIRNNRNWN